LAFAGKRTSIGCLVALAVSRAAFGAYLHRAVLSLVRVIALTACALVARIHKALAVVAALVGAAPLRAVLGAPTIDTGAFP